jgi:hypothetical protein
MSGDARSTLPAASSNGHRRVCEWVGWCERPAEHVVELRNRAGAEQMHVCGLHLAPAQIYGYKPVA